MTDSTQPTQETSTLTTTPQPPFCTNCGNAVSEQAIACMSCGARPTGHKKNCRKCGVALNPEQIVCIKCGSAVRTVGTFQPLGGGVNQRTNFLNAGNMNVGDFIIFAAAFLALFSFFLPWVQATVPFFGTVSASGLSVYAFLLGVVFIYPVWVTLTKMKTADTRFFGYVCAGTGIVLGMIAMRVCKYIAVYNFAKRMGFGALKDSGIMNISDNDWKGIQEIVVNFCDTGSGAYMFICACILLIVGIAIQPRPSGDTKTFSCGNASIVLGATCLALLALQILGLISFIQRFLPLAEEGIYYSLSFWDYFPGLCMGVVIFGAFIGHRSVKANNKAAKTGLLVICGGAFLMLLLTDVYFTITAFTTQSFYCEWRGKHIEYTVPIADWMLYYVIPMLGTIALIFGVFFGHKGLKTNKAKSKWGLFLCWVYCWGSLFCWSVFIAFVLLYGTDAP